MIELKEKQVSDIMTPLDKVFMVDYNDKLELAKIMECGHQGARVIQLIWYLPLFNISWFGIAPFLLNCLSGAEH